MSPNAVMRPRLFLTVVFSIALLQLPPTFAIQRDFFPTPSDYSVKIPDTNGNDYFVEVPAATGNIYACYDFKRINNWQRPPDQSADPSAYQIKFRRVEDAIEMDLSVVFEKIEQFRTLPKKGLTGLHIGYYSARLGETVVLQELASYGIEPINITVVDSRSRVLDSSEIRNQTSSIQLARAEKARNHYQLQLKNISSKNIVGLRVREGLSSIPKNIVGLRVRQGISSISEAGSLIAPAQVYTMGFSGFSSQNRGSTEQGPSLVIADVVFADLTFEGEKEFALNVAAWRRASKIQWLRIIPLLQSALGGLKQDSQGALDNLRQQVTSLGDEAESQVVDEVARYFLPLTEKQRSLLIFELKDRLKSEKIRLLAAIKYHEAEELTKGTNRESWLKYLNETYKAALQKAMSEPRNATQAKIPEQ